MKEKLCLWIKNTFCGFLGGMFLFSLNISIDCIQLLLLPLCAGFFFPFLALVRRLIQKLFKIE